MKLSKTARRNKLLNLAMIAVILVIAAGGVLLVGNLRGWFDASPARAGEEAETAAENLCIQELTGSANILREGIAYALREGNALRPGDHIETLHGACLTASSQRLELTLDGNGAFTLSEDGSLLLESGTLLLQSTAAVTAELQGQRMSAENGSFVLRAPYGSGSVAVLGGSMELGDLSVSAGELLTILPGAGELEKSALTLASLNDFELQAVQGENLCFTAAEAEALRTQRASEAQAALEAKLLAGEEEARLAAMRESAEQTHRGDGAAAPVSDSPTVTITIVCDTILQHMDRLREGKNAYVPSNGCILAASKLSFNEGETVFDVLCRACKLAGIQLEYAWTPAYDSYYVEGINSLYEFDCGELSGWMYRVNGWFPNYGCSSYKLSDGDSIVWCYTCEGLGADVGGSVS